MASSQNSVAAVRAGLVYQAVGLNEHLKVALHDAGVNVVLEILANALSLEVIQRASLDVFVVNLDPELEDSLEALTDMLDQVRRPVIFNDGAASSGLSGWDQARWARHLAAKITGELDATPPRPLDAELIKSPTKPVRAATPLVLPAVILPAVKLPVAVTVVAPVIGAHNSTAADLLPVVPADVISTEDVFAELDFDFDAVDDIHAAQGARPALDEDESGLADFDA